MHGQGTYIFADGDKYIGDWKDGKKHGQGTYIWGDKSEWAGDRYVGEFQNDEKNGQGTYFYANGTKDEGVWKDGEYQYARKDSEPKSNYSNVEEIIPASSGSGFAVTSDGYVVTNYHVIDGCNNVEIIDKGQTIPATVISFDISNDLALLKSDFKPLHTFPLSRKNPYTLMEIYVAGYPFGYDISTPVKITRGIVSSLAGIGNNFSRVQIDAAIQPGNSGGPIINDKGNVIGVAVSKLDLEIMMDSYGVVPEGTNFGIKSNVVINFLESNNINLIDVNTKELSKERLGKTITDGTYYISCLMTMPQIEKMRERKVIFSDLK
jgi:S1-C subfamily serine protease